MAGMTMIKGNKYKYMPLSEANVKPAMVSAFDGQNIYVTAASASPLLLNGLPSGPAAEPKREVRYSMGNYLGGGIAGVVNEAYDKLLQRHVAIKMLNPVGYKLSTPSVLRRAEIIKKGVPIVGSLRGMTPENVFWVKLPAKRDLIACYADFRHAPGSALSTPITTQMLRELTLEMCVALWQLDADEDAGESSGTLNANYSQPQHCREEVKGSGSGSSTTPGCGPALHGNSGVDGASEDEEFMMMMMMNPHGDVDGMDGDAENELMLPPREEEVRVGDVMYKIPTIPAKYKAFLDSRKSIYREIAHMHKLTGNSVSGQLAHGGHPNVLKLYDVLEYIQPSKSTIFLVLELASGGELFDRIRLENGVDENVARSYFTQLLSGVLFCHQLGIVHRDLKPENLLLSDSDVLKIADFGLSAHFIAAVSSGGNGAGVSAAADDALPELDDDDMDAMSTSSSMMIPAARFRRLNSIVGSPHYVAPEVLQNARYGYDGRKADMWSIGVILYGLLAGSLPFGKELPTCPRYLKFCEWIRSLPCDPQTGKLIYDASIYQPSNAPLRIPTTTQSTTTVNETIATHGIMNPTEDDTPVTLRLAQVHPNLQPLSSSGWLQNGKPPIKPSEISAGTATVTPPAPGSRRGSRVVSFPTWLFPSKLSPQAVFLMASLLHPEPGKRLACEDACRAAWVAGISV